MISCRLHATILALLFFGGILLTSTSSMAEGLTVEAEVEAELVFDTVESQLLLHLPGIHLRGTVAAESPMWDEASSLDNQVAVGTHYAWDTQESDYELVLELTEEELQPVFTGEVSVERGGWSLAASMATSSGGWETGLRVSHDFHEM